MAKVVTSAMLMNAQAEVKSLEVDTAEIKRKEKESVAARYEADRQRWRELMAAKAKAERKPAMKPFASLSKGDLDALVAYLQVLGKSEPVTPGAKSTAGQ